MSIWILLICAGCASHLDPSLQQARKVGVLRIGYAVEAPFAFLTPKGEVTGESPEIAKVVAQRVGITHIEWHLTNFGSLLSELESGRYEMVAAGLFITPERSNRVAFSHPTFRVRSALLVRKGSSPGPVRSYKELAQIPEIRLAVLDNSVEESALSHYGMKPTQLVAVPDAVSGATLVKSGKVDGLALSAPTVRWLAREDHHKSTESLELPEDEHGFLGGFAFRPKDQSLRLA